MIEIEISADANVATVTPKGTLSSEDFDKLQRAIDGYINAHDKVPNLVIMAHELPHWDGLAALGRHVHFVSEHQKVVRKVAIVSDSPVLAVLPEIANCFVAATVRRFPESKAAQARAWAEADGDDPGRFEPIEGLPSDVLAFRAVGIITADDYRETLVPLVEAKLKEHDKLKVLIVLDEDYASYSAGAAWDDMRLGLTHWGDFSRIALVTDIGWMAQATRLFAPLMRAEVKTFPLGELDEAKSWIKR